MKDEVVYTETYDPQLEADALANMSKHARHQRMLEQHVQAKSDRRNPEWRNRGRSFRRVIADMI